MEDITIRALKTLELCDYIFCEDTRVTKKLLDRHDISVKTLKIYNDHSGEDTRWYIKELIESGNNVALVSDAGTPLISDPGYKLINYLQDNSVSIETIPGASSVVSAITISGLPSDNFYFGGFLPQKTGQKINFFAELLNVNSTLIFFDRANRVPTTLEAINEVFGDVEVSIVREITKLYEETIKNKVSELIKLERCATLRGEIVLLIDNGKKNANLTEQDIDRELEKLLEDHSIKDASKIASEKFSIAKKDAYSKLLEIKENMS